MIAVIFVSLLPVIFLILMGGLLRARGGFDQSFWFPCEKLNYYYLFPALMFSLVSKVDLHEFPIGPIAYSTLGAVLFGGVTLLLWRLWIKQSGPVFSSVMQGALRPNTYIGVAAAAAIYGHTGMMVTSISIAVAIPLLNVVSVVVLMVYGEGSKSGWLHIMKSLLKNPVILSVLAGISFNMSGLSLPAVINNILNILGGASLPLGLLAVGAGLDIRAARAANGPVMQSSFVKLLLIPAVTLLIGVSLGVSGEVLATVVLFNAMPCTPSAYIMSKLLGGDHQLASGIITIQTMLASVTIPAVLMLSQSFT